MTDDDFIADVRKKYERAAEAFADNRDAWRDDVRFAKLGDIWPEDIKKQREADGQPCLVIPRLPAFIRRVVNEARQNRPAINVVPADSGADVETAEIMSGLIRNIEVSSDADIAYDTAVDAAVSGGFGFFQINTAYTSDDTFDQDIVIERIADPLTVLPDPDSDSVDGSDWNCCFVSKTMTKDDFEDQYKGAEKVDWDADYSKLGSPWFDGENVTVAAYWHREDAEHQIVALNNGTVVSMDEWREGEKIWAALGIEQIGQPRTVKTKKVTQYILSGAEVLETIEWPGKYIPIVMVIGDEVIVEGKRTFKSLIRDAKDSERDNCYWRSMATETIALAPKVPFVGPEGAFDSDVEKWSTVNDSSHAFITYKGQIPPQRQGATGPSAGELQLAIAAIDDMKAIMGIYDVSLGQRSNETSGVAIRQRQRQGDIAVYHFMDNLTRSIRHGGRILIDLIQKVKTTAGVIRTLGEDMEPRMAQIGPGGEQPDGMEQAKDIQRIYDLGAGKYDLVVKAGPSFGTQREAAREELVEVIRAFPQAAPVLGPMYLRNSDWPGADDAADKLEAMSNPPEQQGLPPELQQQLGQMQQAMQAGQQRLAELEAENETLKQQWMLKNRELDIKESEAQTKAHEVKVKELSALMAAQQPQAPTAPQGAQQASNPYGLA